VAANELSIVNQALLNLGESILLTSGAGTVAGIVETDTPQGRAAQAYYTLARQDTLRAFPWPWATKFALLVLADDGDGEVWEHEWRNAYTYPADCLQVLRFLTRTTTTVGSLTDIHHREADPYAPKYVIGSHGGAKVIFTDVETGDAKIEYIEDVSTTTRFSPLFDTALSWRLAYSMAMALSADPRLRDWALQHWGASLSVAHRVEANEGNPPTEWLTESSYTRARHI
jgi:hypothetical protein